MREHLTIERLEQGLDHVREAPAQRGIVELIARRPQPLEREILEEARLDTEQGLVGDRWYADADRDPLAQLTLMSARAAALLTGGDDADFWAQAGDQVFVDLDLSTANLPAGTRLRLGTATVEITDQPHLGCGKFAKRFGVDALKLVNRADARALRLRGVNARIVDGGELRRGDAIERL